MSLRRKVSTLLIGLAVAGLLAACGSSHKPLLDENNTGAGGVNSAYITLNRLQYQVEVSRALNPYDAEDQSYLEGVPAAEHQPPPGEIWFAVFLLVENNGSHAATAASSFTLSDTQGHAYHPRALPSVNPFAYRPLSVAPGAQIPAVGSVGADGPTQAALLLFEIPSSAYDNRPLILRIADPLNSAIAGTVTLDV
jgi:hypothetical protein